MYISSVYVKMVLTIIRISGINYNMKKMKSQETKNPSPERQNKKPNYTLRRWGAVVVGTAVVFAGVNGLIATAKHSESSEKIPKNNTPQLPNYLSRADIDQNIIALSLAEGARVRSEPAVTKETNSNILEEIEKPVEIPADEGMVVSHDVNGDWFGFPAEDLKESLKRVDPDLDFDPKADSDGYVWVNEQRATPQYSQPADD